MRLGFSGAHRTGKSTLAAAISELLDIPFVQSTAGSIAKDQGFDFNKDNSFSRRIDYQDEVLYSMERDYSRGDSFTSDRTPLDAAAYLLADVRAVTGDSATQERVCQYVDRARVLTSNMFDIVIVIPPAIDVEPLDGKPPVNPAYQEHHHHLVRGMLFDPDIRVKQGQILFENTDRGDRVQAVLNFVHDWERENCETMAA